MTDDLKKNILAFELGEITKKELLNILPFSIDRKSQELRQIIENIIISKNGSNVEYGLTLLWLLEEDYEFTDLLHKLILEPWHTKYEDIIHSLQVRKDPKSVPFIKVAIQQKYEYLEAYGTGTGQFISQCGYALRSIGTKEALDTIKYLAKNSDDSIIKKEMEYQLDKLLTLESSTKNKKRWWEI